MKKTVAHQLVSVAIEASGRAFQLYESGVFTGEGGANMNMMHLSSHGSVWYVPFRNFD